MRSKFYNFMKKRFSRAEAACPKYLWDRFILEEFVKGERADAERYTQSLINKGYIMIEKRENGEFMVISEYGYEMLVRGQLEI